MVWCLYYVVYSGGQVRPSHSAPTDDAPSISYGGKGFPTGGQVIPSSGTVYMFLCVCMCMIEIHKQTVLHGVFAYTHAHNLLHVLYAYIKLQFVGGGGRVVPRIKGSSSPYSYIIQNLNYIYLRLCVRSLLNTNKALLTYCQLSEVNLSRINFHRKRFRPSFSSSFSLPENPLVSNYLRIDRSWWRRSDDESLSLSLYSLFISLFLFTRSHTLFCIRRIE